MDGTLQGDPTATAIHAIAIIPLTLMLVAEANQVDNTTKTAAYADDLTAAGTIMRLRNWWQTLCRLGPKFGYFPEGSKSWLTVKEKEVQKVQSVFKDTNIKNYYRGSATSWCSYWVRNIQAKICSRKNRPMDKRVACVV